MRTTILAISIAMTGFFITQNSFAGACDTNVTSLQRLFDRKCQPKPTRAECDTCADQQFNSTVIRIETCRPQLQDRLNNFKTSVCSTKQ